MLPYCCKAGGKTNNKRNFEFIIKIRTGSKENLFQYTEPSAQGERLLLSGSVSIITIIIYLLGMMCHKWRGKYDGRPKRTYSCFRTLWTDISICKLCSTSFSLYLTLVFSCSAVLWSQLMSNYSLCLFVALPSIICGFFWAKSASLAWDHYGVMLSAAAQVTLCFRPLGNAPRFLWTQKWRERYEAAEDGSTQLSSDWMSASWRGDCWGGGGDQTLGFCKVPWDHIDCNRRYKNKAELRMPTQCVFCPGLVGSSAIFLNSHSCACAASHVPQLKQTAHTSRSPFISKWSRCPPASAPSQLSLGCPVHSFVAL